VNPREHVRIQIDDEPDGGRVFQIDEPTDSSDVTSESHTFGSVSISQSKQGGMNHVRVDTNSPTSFSYYLAVATVIGLIIATVLGASFAKEADGHLEFALTKPVSRLRFALGNVGVDFAGIVIAEIMTMIGMALAHLLFEVPHYYVDLQTLFVLLAALLGPFAWYAMLNAATASMRRGASAIVGLSWIIAFGIIGAGKVHLPTALGDAAHAIFSTLARFIPMNYMELSIRDSGAITNVNDQPATLVNVAILFTLLAIYSALAVWQWRRVEA
jgi:hypothetical protein